LKKSVRDVEDGEEKLRPLTLKNSLGVRSFIAEHLWRLRLRRELEFASLNIMVEAKSRGDVGIVTAASSSKNGNSKNK
jgi:hypothetical protein